MNFIFRALTNTIHLAVKRAGEVGLFNLNDSVFEEDDQCFQNTWFQPKTARSDCMTFVHDADTWLLDYHVSMAGYLITCGSKYMSEPAVKEGRRDTYWIFPSLHKISPENISKHITRMLKQLVGHVDGVYANASSHCWKHGATDDMTANDALDIVAVLQRGAWYIESESAGFIYIAKRRNDLRAANVLAGYDNIKAIVYAPPTDLLKGMITDDKFLALTKMMEVLFEFLPFSIFETDSLFSYRNVLMGSVLSNFKGITNELGKSNSLCEVVVVGTANRTGIQLAELLQWGDYVSNVYDLCVCINLIC